MMNIIAGVIRLQARSRSLAGDYDLFVHFISLIFLLLTQAALPRFLFPARLPAVQQPATRVNVTHCERERGSTRLSVTQSAAVVLIKRETRRATPFSFNAATKLV